jgi:protein SCO1/2
VSTRPPAVLLLAMFLLAGCGRSFTGTPMQPAVVARDVPLHAGAGTLSFAHTEGRVSLVTFGYTACPDVCPATLSKWRGVRRALGADTSHVRFVFVSGDWRHDTPELVEAYVHQFDPAFHGAFADSATILRVLPQFQAEVGYGGPPGSPTEGFAHSDYDYVVDESGRILFWYPFQVTEQQLTADLRHLVRAHGLAKG